MTKRKFLELLQGNEFYFNVKEEGSDRTYNVRNVTGRVGEMLSKPLNQLIVEATTQPSSPHSKCVIETLMTDMGENAKIEATVCDFSDEYTALNIDVANGIITFNLAPTDFGSLVVA